MSPRGFGIRLPNGRLARAIYATKEAARTEAAFTYTGKMTIRFRTDWRKAYRAGWRVVPVVLKESWK